MVFVIIYLFVIIILNIGVYYTEFNMLKESRYSDKTFINYISESKLFDGFKYMPTFSIIATLVMLIDRMGSNYFIYLCLSM
jgi:hypothetical protein